MNLVTVLDFVNLFFAGILAGIEIVIHYGLRAPTEVLDDQSQIQLRQALVLRLRVLVPAFFVPTAVSGIAVTVLDGAAPGFWFQCAGVIAMLIWILIRVIGTVPINSTTAWRATKELESASRPRGAVPYCWCLGGSHGVCALLNGPGTPAGRSLTFEKAASMHEMDRSLLRLLYCSASAPKKRRIYGLSNSEAICTHTGASICSLDSCRYQKYC